MKVQIEGNLYLEADGTQFIIKEYMTSKEGKEYSVTHGYFSQLRHAVMRLVKMKVMESTATDLKTLLKDVEAIKNDIETMVYI